jgi:hypothetical protein
MKNYISPNIEIINTYGEGELLAGFNPGSKSPNPPKTGKGAKSFNYNEDDFNEDDDEDFKF